MTAHQKENDKQAAKRYFKRAGKDIEAAGINTKLGLGHWVLHLDAWRQENPRKVMGLCAATFWLTFVLFTYLNWEGM